MNYPLVAVIVIAVLAILYFMSKNEKSESSSTTEGLKTDKIPEDNECEGGVCKRKPRVKKEKMD